MAISVIRRVDPLSLGKVWGLVYCFIGLIAGAIFALISTVGAGFASALSQSGQPWLGAIFGVGAIIILPIFYGVLGFVVGLIGALIYNLVAGWVGGIQIELG